MKPTDRDIIAAFAVLGLAWLDRLPTVGDAIHAAVHPALALAKDGLWRPEGAGSGRGPASLCGRQSTPRTGSVRGEAAATAARAPRPARAWATTPGRAGTERRPTGPTGARTTRCRFSGKVA